MAVPYAKCSSLCRHLFHFWERKSEDSWACKVRLKESRLVGSKETSPAVRPQDAIWCGIRKESGIICQAQPPGIWVLIDASGRSSYQEAPCCPGIWKIMLRFAFFFLFLSQYCSSKCYCLPSTQPPSFLYDSSVSRTHLSHCTIWYGRERVLGCFWVRSPLYLWTEASGAELIRVFKFTFLFLLLSI